ncbi:medium-chain acyl-CoA ligase ACSF2, mitochondrial [Salmo salar]|uniref:Medium-chain acyl-CoA ligase ACSF2, mitochondrial n=1 Tax=Salmo salar TaxID=8030 RepID=A0ABM3E5A8_SALSA|nr:medium-chain acyl-CoA ligase ACSF2, mitochondrial-like [Salmo salar]
MIIQGGENIHPAEIEQFLHTHPKVQETQVIGIKDGRMGTEVCACIELTERQDCSAEDIKVYCKGKIPHCDICEGLPTHRFRKVSLKGHFEIL